MVYLICCRGTVSLLQLQTLLEMKTPFTGEVTLKVSRPAELSKRSFVQWNDCFGLKKVVRWWFGEFDTGSRYSYISIIAPLIVEILMFWLLENCIISAYNHLGGGDYNSVTKFQNGCPTLCECDGRKFIYEKHKRCW